MKLIKIANSQFLPAQNIDLIIIPQDDPTTLIVHTVGGYTINNYYHDENMCRKDYERIYKELEIV